MQNVVNKKPHTHNLKQRFKYFSKKFLLTSAIASTLLSSTSNNFTNINTPKPNTNYAYAQTQNNQQQLDEITKKLQEFAEKKDYEKAKKYIKELVEKGVITEIANSEKFNPSHFFFDKFLDGKKLATGGDITYDVIKDYVFPYTDFNQTIDKFMPLSFQDRANIGIQNPSFTSSYPVFIAHGPHVGILYRLVKLTFIYENKEVFSLKPDPIPTYTIEKSLPNYNENYDGATYLKEFDISKYYIKSYSVVIPNQSFSVDTPIAAFNVSFYIPANSDQWKVSVLPIYAGNTKKTLVTTIYLPHKNDFKVLRAILTTFDTNFLLNEPFTTQTTLTKPHFNNLKTLATYVTIKNNQGNEFYVPVIVLSSQNFLFYYIGNIYSMIIANKGEEIKTVPNFTVYLKDDNFYFVFDFYDSKSLVIKHFKYSTENATVTKLNDIFLVN